MMGVAVGDGVTPLPLEVTPNGELLVSNVLTPVKDWDTLTVTNTTTTQDTLVFTKSATTVQTITINYANSGVAKVSASISSIGAS